ncbi:MAG: hypothetical protein KF854_00810 [Nitrospira sp.]|nr:hypothetical protein [Nitrospira sp.]MBX3513125.1 hypothetical protein [Xanthobacteraceae bacterium]
MNELKKSAAEMMRLADEYAAKSSPRAKYDPVNAGFCGAGVVAGVLLMFSMLSGIEVFGLAGLLTIAIGFAAPFLLLRSQNEANIRATVQAFERIRAGQKPNAEVAEPDAFDHNIASEDAKIAAIRKVKARKLIESTTATTARFFNWEARLAIISNNQAFVLSPERGWRLVNGADVTHERFDELSVAGAADIFVEEILEFGAPPFDPVRLL